MNYKHAKKKFDEAIFAMAVSPDSLQVRLKSAFRFYLNQLTEKEIPEEFKNDFMTMKKVIMENDIELTDYGWYEELIKAMLDEQAKMIAHRLVEIRHELKHYQT